MNSERYTERKKKCDKKISFFSKFICTNGFPL